MGFLETLRNKAGDIAGDIKNKLGARGTAKYSGTAWSEKKLPVDLSGGQENPLTVATRGAKVDVKGSYTGLGGKGKFLVEGSLLTDANAKFKIAGLETDGFAGRFDGEGDIHIGGISGRSETGQVVIKGEQDDSIVAAGGGRGPAEVSIKGVNAGLKTNLEVKGHVPKLYIPAEGKNAELDPLRFEVGTQNSFRLTILAQEAHGSPQAAISNKFGRAIVVPVTQDGPLVGRADVSQVLAGFSAEGTTKVKIDGTKARITFPVVKTDEKGNVISRKVVGFVADLGKIEGDLDEGELFKYAIIAVGGWSKASLKGNGGEARSTLGNILGAQASGFEPKTIVAGVGVKANLDFAAKIQGPKAGSVEEEVEDTTDLAIYDPSRIEDTSKIKGVGFDLGPASIRQRLELGFLAGYVASEAKYMDPKNLKGSGLTKEQIKAFSNPSVSLQVPGGFTIQVTRDKGTIFSS